MTFATAVQEMLHAPVPSRVLERMVMRPAGMPPLLPLAAEITAGPAPYHSGSVLKHLSRVMDAVASDPLTVWMAFAHDLGKLTTPQDILPHHYGHERRGMELAQQWGALAQLPASMITAGVFTAWQHMRAARYAEMRKSKRHELLRMAQEARIFSEFWRVVDADSKSDISVRALREWESLCQPAAVATPHTSTP